MCECVCVCVCVRLMSIFARLWPNLVTPLACILAGAMIHSPTSSCAPTKQHYPFYPQTIFRLLNKV